jgi:hypothetical protein
VVGVFFLCASTPSSEGSSETIAEKVFFNMVILEEVIMDLHPKYSDLHYTWRLVCDRVIIADESLTAVGRRDLQSLETVDGSRVEILEGVELSSMLDAVLENEIKRPNTLVVFPGNGALYPYRYSSLLQHCVSTAVSAGRFWVPGQDPIAYTGMIHPEIFMDLRTERVVVVDDVVCSGATCIELHKRNAWRFPKATWVAAAWVIQAPQSRSRSGVTGYTSALGAVVVSKNNGNRSAVNSLSTLRSDPEVRNSYVKRHIAEKDQEMFFRILQTSGAP